MTKIGESELILNPDGSIYHLHLKPADVADTIILVGDQERVPVISGFFERIDFKMQNREFVTHTGWYKGKRLSVLSTGIGTDNIDIVINELDAIKNIDLKTRTVKKQHTPLNFIRIGTSGSLQASLAVDTPVVAEYSLGFDGLLNFYANRKKISHQKLEEIFVQYMNWNAYLARPYFIEASEKLLTKIGKDMAKGITISSLGFYGPQGRILRIPLAVPDMNKKLTHFEYNNLRINNYEMESSAIYGLSRLLGHNALTVCLIIANRIRKEYSKDYKKTIKILIEKILNRIVE